MMLRKALIIKIFILSSAWCFHASAAPVCSTEASCFKPKLTWSVDKQGRISDVCHNYAYGHWKYRQCRMAAQSRFKELCAQYKAQEKSTQGKYRADARLKQRTYCVAFRQ